MMAPWTETTVTDRQTLRQARQDIVTFAELVGQPLWDHQVRLAKDPAKIRIVLAGRQCGKSRTEAMLAIHTAFARPGQRVLVLSAVSQRPGICSEITACVRRRCWRGAW